MHFVRQASMRFAAFLFVNLSVALSINAQQKSTFSTPDLRAFELKGHVKSMWWTGPRRFEEDYETPKYGLVSFSVAGNVMHSEFKLFVNDDGYISEIEGLEVKAARKEAEKNGEEYDSRLYFGTLGAPVYSLVWKDSKVTEVYLDDGSCYVTKGLIGADGNMTTTKCVGGSMAEWDGTKGKTWTVKYHTYDNQGNWISRDNESRIIEYYTFEDDFKRFKQGEGTLDDIAEVASTFALAKMSNEKAEAEALWNQRALASIQQGSNINEVVTKIVKADIATESTRTAAIEKWNAFYLEKLRAGQETPAVVKEILASSLATDNTLTMAIYYWNEFYKKEIENASDPMAAASSIIDNSLMDEENRAYILALVHNYEIEHHVNGITDYNALYRAAEVKCGPHYVFNDEERKKIVFNADQYKRQATNALIVRSQQLMNDLKLDESRECALQALAIEPTYATAREQRAEVEYRILWGHIMTVSATPEMIATYSRNNPESRYNHDLELVSTILLHLDHKCSAPRKLYKKMLKYHGIPEEAKVIKVVQKCMKKDAK